MTPNMARAWAASEITSGNIVTDTLIIPYPPIFSSTPASITLTAVGASVCASGSQVWSGKIGSLTANAMKSSVKRTPMGIIGAAAAIPAGSSVMSKVPVMKKRARMPTSMNAEPREGVDEELHRRVFPAPAPPYGDEEEHGHKLQLP